MQVDIQNNIGMIGVNPHRFPMVLIDRVIENGSIIITEKFISLNDYEFRHADFQKTSEFIYPGWLVIESFFQSAGLFLRCVGREFSPYVVLCKNVEVRRNIFAGEIVRHHVFLDDRKDSLIIVSGKSMIGEETVICYRQVWLGFAAV